MLQQHRYFTTFTALLLRAAVHVHGHFENIPWAASAQRWAPRSFIIHDVVVVVAAGTRGHQTDVDARALAVTDRWLCDEPVVKRTNCCLWVGCVMTDITSERKKKKNLLYALPQAVTLRNIITHNDHNDELHLSLSRCCHLPNFQTHKKY